MSAAHLFSVAVSALIAIPLLIGAIALTFGSVGLEVLFNDWNRRFYDSIQNKDEAVFWTEIKTFSFLAVLYIAVAVTRYVVSPYLRLRWRRWLTALAWGRPWTPWTPHGERLIGPPTGTIWPRYGRWPTCTPTRPDSGAGCAANWRKPAST